MHGDLIDADATARADRADARLHFAAAVNDERILARDLLRSPIIRAGAPVTMQRAASSASTAFNQVLDSSREDIVIFVHQDVYLPPTFQRALTRAIRLVEAADPNWAVLGVFGVSAGGVPVGRVWSSGLHAELGGPFHDPVRAQSVDELLIVLRGSSSLRFDERLPGFHLYGTDIVQEALSGGLGAYVVHAPVVHNSRPCPYLTDEYFRAYRFLASKWRSRLPVTTCTARIVATGTPAWWQLRLRHRYVQWRCAGIDRATLDRKLDAVEIAEKLGYA